MTGILDKWHMVENKHPERHQGPWLVQRDGFGFFMAKVCYGMHDPWWVPRVPDENSYMGWKETDPIAMKPTDKWRESDK